MASGVDTHAYICTEVISRNQHAWFKSDAHVRKNIIDGIKYFVKRKQKLVKTISMNFRSTILDTMYVKMLLME